jgi:hypothetical protein
MYYYFLFTVFALVSIAIIIDPNVGEYIVLLTKLVKSKMQRIYWMIRFHPVVFSSPIGKWWMMKKYMKIAEDLKKEQNP